MATIKDIAQKAGVSIGTVDRVLHDLSLIHILQCQPEMFPFQVRFYSDDALFPEHVFLSDNSVR